MGIYAVFVKDKYGGYAYEKGFPKMKRRIFILLCACISLLQTGCNCNSKIATDQYIIEKENGQIILAYRAFKDFLDSDRSWGSYKSILLDAYPQVQVAVIAGRVLQSNIYTGLLFILNMTRICDAEI